MGNADQKGYAQAWATANKKRRVIIERRTQSWLGDAGIGWRGYITGEIEERNYVPRWYVSTNGYIVDPSDLAPADGLGPFIIPCLVNGEWTWDGKDAIKQINWTVLPQAPLVEVTRTPSATDLNRIQDRAVEIEKAALRTLHFLADLVPLPGWAPSTERELMACARELKAAMKGKKS